MSAPAAMTLPGGRVVLDWVRHLTGLSPRRLWFAHLIVHQVEALIETTAARPLASLADAVRLFLARSQPTTAARLAEEMAIDPGLIQEALSDLARHGRAIAGSDGWRAADGEPPPPHLERRTFTFTDGRPAVYLPLSPGNATPIAALPGWRFELATLEACVQQSAEWKQSHGFPPEVRRVVVPNSDWRSVSVDQPGQILLLFVEVPAQPQCVLGFGVRVADWTLSAEPLLRLPTDSLASLGIEADPDAWLRAWQAWCQQRNLPGSEVDSCQLQAIDHRLVIHAPARLLDRLRTARSDVLKGETWLLAGTGRIRPMAMVELVSGE